MILRFDTKSIQKFCVVLIDSGLEFVNLSFHFIEVFKQGLGRFCVFFYELYCLVAQNFVTVASYFSSDLRDCFINFIVIPFGIQ
jgi:hypothetical protein